MDWAGCVHGRILNLSYEPWLSLLIRGIRYIYIYVERERGREYIRSFFKGPLGCIHGFWILAQMTISIPWGGSFFSESPTIWGSWAPSVLI